MKIALLCSLVLDLKIDCNVDMSSAPEGKRRRGRPKTTWRSTVEKERQESSWRSGRRCRLQQPIERSGKVLQRPYVP